MLTQSKKIQSNFFVEHHKYLHIEGNFFFFENYKKEEKRPLLNRIISEKIRHWETLRKHSKWCLAVFVPMQAFFQNNFSKMIKII